jgi:hypothetical protein
MEVSGPELLACVPDDVAWGLCEAASEGKLDVLRWLCQRGEENGVRTRALVNDEDPGTSSLLFQEAGGGHVDVVQWLVENGVELAQRDTAGRTVLHLAWPARSAAVGCRARSGGG